MAKWNIPEMSLYLITRTAHSPCYDVANSMVVRARDEQEAREEAALKAMDEGMDAWIKPENSYCEIISLRGDAQVICMDTSDG